jgi:hypothetical protein
VTTESVNTAKLRFRIELRDISPPIWRRIDVPGDYSFWDLHVAIQDAMGWCDYHLHAFRSPESGGSDSLEIGIPDDNEFMTGRRTIAGWEVPVSSRFDKAGQSMVYEYDFGDGWIHDVVLEKIIPCDAPQRVGCVGGERACPPEDCGGNWGYQAFLEAVADPRHEEHEDMMRWIGGEFDPEAFDPAKVSFDDPKERWAIAFAQS